MASAQLQQPSGGSRNVRVLGKKAPQPAKPIAVKSQHLRVPSDTSMVSKSSQASSPNGNVTTTTVVASGSRPVSPARLDSPISETSVESASSVTSEETSSQNLTCPICNESMVTLLQLNRHIDDIHSEIEKTEEDQIKSWFKKKVVKARQLQSVTSVFNSRFSKLDLFDSEDTTASDSTVAKKPVVVQPKPTIVVTREHWQKSSGFDKCSDPICEKALNTRNGSVNCRKCGKLFCSYHTKYEMKLSKTAHHDPSHGVWSRVCETCYKSRPGYLDYHGTTRDLTSAFKNRRQVRIDDHELEVNKLEKRLVKLIRILMDPKFTSDPTNIFSYSKATARRNAERAIIPWQDDVNVTDCPICTNKFDYALRKHHCRLCGRVVCASHSTNCSRDAPISILIDKLGPSQFGIGSNGNTLKYDVCIRICNDCKDTVFAKRNFEADLQGPKSDLLRFYDTLMPIRRSIDTMLPKFQEMLAEINNPEHPPPPSLLHEATRVRRRLLDSFVQFDTTARKISGVKAHSEEEVRLRHQIHSVAAQYLQDNMLPLKALPKVLKHSKTPSHLSSVTSAAEEAQEQASTPPPPVLDKTEIQALREQVIVLEEQRFLVQGMVNEAQARRKFDEVVPLKQSLADLDSELEKVRLQLGSEAI